MLLAAIALVFLSNCAAPGNSGPDELLKIEEQRYRAMEKIDRAFLNGVFHEDLLFVHASGRTDTRDSFMQRLGENGLMYRSIRSRNLRARVYGNCGIVTGISDLDLLVQGTPRTLNLIFTSTYAKQNGAWKLVSYQSTNLPANE